MTTAFVLLNVEIGFMDKVLKSLRQVESVKEAYSVYGVYDIVAKVEAENMDELKNVITWRIRRLDNVRTTLTMIVIEG